MSFWTCPRQNVPVLQCHFIRGHASIQHFNASSSHGPPNRHGTGAYSDPPREEDHGLSVSELGNLGHGFSACDIEDLEHTALPPGWHVKGGYIVLNDTSKDYWEVKAGCLIRHHVVPRRSQLTQFDKQIHVIARQRALASAR